MSDTPKGTRVLQKVAGGGEFVAEISRATAPTGRDKGHITREVSQFATAGCTCGWWSDDMAEVVEAAFETHVEGHSEDAA